MRDEHRAADDHALCARVHGLQAWEQRRDRAELGAGERLADAAPDAAAERHVERVLVVAVGAEGVRVRERVRVAVGEQ